MRALVVAPQPFFSPRGTPFSVYHRTVLLAEAGVNIDLLTYGQGEDVSIKGVRIIRIPAFRFLGGIKVGPSILKLFLDVFLVAWTLALLLRRRYDVVHAHEESVFFCRFLKPVFRFKLIYDMHSSLPQQLTNFQFTRSRLLIGLFDRLESSCLRAADAVITISPALAEIARARMPDAKRHFLIENSILDPVRLEREAEKEQPTEDWQSLLPSNRTLITYAGTFEVYQGLELLIDAFSRVLGSQPDAFFLLVGGTPEQVRHYQAIAVELGLGDHSLFTGRVPQSTARALLERADILTSPRREGDNTPLKVYELLASGKPFVATRIPSHTQVLSDEVCYLAEPAAEPLAEALLAALRDPDESSRRAQAARSLYETRYSRAAYEAKIQALLEALD